MRKYYKNFFKKTGYALIAFFIALSYMYPAFYALAQTDGNTSDQVQTETQENSNQTVDTNQSGNSDTGADNQTDTSTADAQALTNDTQDDDDGAPDVGQVLSEIEQIKNDFTNLDTDALVRDRVDEIKADQEEEDSTSDTQSDTDTAGTDEGDTTDNGNTDNQSNSTDTQNQSSDLNQTDGNSNNQDTSNQENQNNNPEQDVQEEVEGTLDDIRDLSVDTPSLDDIAPGYGDTPPRNADEAQDLVDALRDRVDERELRTDDVQGSGSTQTTTDDTPDLTEDPTTTTDIDLQNGDDSIVVADNEKNDSATIETDNNLVQENITEGEAVSGGNTIESEKDILEGSIYTGSSNVEGSGKAQGNSTSVSTGGGGSTGWIQRSYGADSDNSVSGDDNYTSANSKEVKELTIVNKNKAFLSNVQDLLSKSGDNKISAKLRFKNGGIYTGNSVVKASFLNLINTNTVDSEFLPLNIDIYDPLTGNINIMELLFEAFGATLEANGVVSSTSDSSAEGDGNIQDTSSTVIDRINVENNNEGYIYNDLKLTGISGWNKLLAGYKAKQFDIQTGDVQIMANLINFLNTNLFKSKIGVITLNVYTDWAGSLILPTAQKLADDVKIPGETYVNSEISADNVDDTISSSLAIANSDLDIVSVQQGNIKTEIDINANSGENTISFGKTSGKMNVQTGRVKTLTNILTLANRDIVGLSFSQGFFNILGEWSGTVAGVPDKAVLKGKSNNFIISDVSSAFGNGQAGVVKTSSELNDASDTVQNTSSRLDRSTRLKNLNDGTIVNKIDILADSGNNDVSAYKGRDGSITSGDISVGLNSANFLNNNFSFSKGLIVAVNVFGKWRGNIAYDDIKDLSVYVSVLDEKRYLDRGDTVVYEIEVLNSGTKPTDPGTVTYKFDSNRFKLTNMTGGGDLSGDTITWSYPAMQPGEKTIYKAVLVIKDDLLRGHYNISATATLNNSNDENDNNDNSVYEYGFNLEGYVDPIDNSDGNNDASNGTDNSNNDGNSNGDAQSLGGNGNSGGNDTDNGQGDSTGDNIGPVGGGFVEGYLLVEKEVTSYGPWNPGDEVFYKIKAMNPGDTEVYDVVVYDNLVGQGITSPASWPIDTVLPGETVIIEYSIVVEGSMPEGEYTNYAYASGFDKANAVIRSNDATTKVYLKTGNIKSSGGQSDDGGVDGGGDDSGQGNSLGDGQDNGDDVIDEITTFNQESSPTIEIVRSPVRETVTDDDVSNQEEEDLEVISQVKSEEIKDTATISRYIPVVKARSEDERDEPVTGVVKGDSDVMDKRVAYSIYPNFLYFDENFDADSNDEYSMFGKVFASVKNNFVWLLFAIGVLFTAYIGYREKKRREELGEI